ncbi:MAG: dihydroorotate dehydrogenase [Acidobacteria bacterium]|nr:dihydroorotate dehydrogenase [Acidobacteriota bacterium]MCG3192218.1 Dihydroorotate dehydrogenase B (NAD(+)), catalytic subunit [Thermoanaerobaculia bacterium]MCK6681937.1 dihydroorotate dehydrogenase [Thermoanaerobaculia bacterium]
MSVDLAVKLGSLKLRNPIATASGTFGYGLEFASFVNLKSLGAISVKGLSLRPCLGNPPPRICETDAGMLNAIGLQNVGVEAFLSEKLPELHRLGATVIANVWGDTEEDYEAVITRLGDDPRLAAIELNVSCPNVVKGGMVFGNDPQALALLVKRVRACTRLPLIVKLSPNAGDVVATAAAAVEAGADILSMINTIVGLSIDLEKREPKIGFTTGGLSGPAIRPIALRMVWEVRRALPGVPIFGMGGIETVENVLEFLIAGADAIQVGTANFRDPTVSGRLVRDLEKWCDRNGVEKVTELTATLKTRPRPEHRYA